MNGHTSLVERIASEEVLKGYDYPCLILVDSLSDETLRKHTANPETFT